MQHSRNTSNMAMGMGSTRRVFEAKALLAGSTYDYSSNSSIATTKATGMGFVPLFLRLLSMIFIARTTANPPAKLLGTGPSH